MTRIVWDQVTERDYEAGLDRGVFYPLNGPGHPWNGLVSVEESPSEDDVRTRYLDGQKINDKRRKGEFAGTIEAFTYPTVFSDGMISPHRRTHFSLSYRIQTATGYKLHLVYNAVAAPTEHNFTYGSADPFSWTFTTRGMSGPNNMVVSHLVIDDYTYPETLSALEDVLYGNDSQSPRMPTPDEVFEIFEENSILRIIDNGDGSWTAIGPDEAITNNPDGSFEITWPSAVWLSIDTYQLSSL